MSNPSFEPRPGDTDNALLRKIGELLFAGLSGGGTVTGAVSIADPNTPANGALVTNSAPPGGAYALAVRVVGAATGTAPVSIADGADVAQGTTTDAAITNPATNGTIIAFLRGILTFVNRIPALGQAVMASSAPVVIASNQSAVPVSGTFFQATQPVSGTVTTTPPANASTNVAQISGTAADTNSGAKSAGTLRVTLATDQVQLTNALKVDGSAVTQPVSGTVTTTPPANASTNVAQLAGTTTDTNSGTKSAGTLRVVIATDQVALTNAQPANQTQVNGVAVSVSSGNTDTGTQRVILATDQGAVATKAGTGTVTDRSGTIATGGTRQQLAASNSTRKYLLIQNNSGENMWFNFTTNAVQSQPSILLLPNGSFVMEGSYVSTEAIDIIAATTGSTFSAKEG